MFINLCTALPADDIAFISHWNNGICPNVDHNIELACFNNGLPSIDCRQNFGICDSGQAKVTNLNVESRPGPCDIFTWIWKCTLNTLIPCTQTLWCDEIATCNTTQNKCLCPSNLTVVDDDGGCGCSISHYLLNLNGSYNCLKISPPCNVHENEVPATRTSDRLCVPKPDQPSDDDNNTWFIVGVTLFTISLIILFVILCLYVVPVKNSFTVQPSTV